MTSDAAPRNPGRKRFGALGSIAVVALLLAACGSSKAQTTSAITSTCNRVSAVLSDGPDPDADPVGYALAQVIPLRQIHTSDAKLKSDIEGLAASYERFYETKGSSAAKAAVSRASEAINSVCPGAAS